MAGPRADCDVALAHELRVAVLRLARRIRAARVDTSLSLSQLSALALLDVHGPMSAGELAALESVQPPTMSKIVAGLVQRGLVTRDADPDDKRSVRLAASPAGHDAVDAERRARDAWLSAELADLPPAERRVLERSLPVLGRIGVRDDAAGGASGEAVPGAPKATSTAAPAL